MGDKLKELVSLFDYYFDSLTIDEIAYLTKHITNAIHKKYIKEQQNDK